MLLIAFDRSLIVTTLERVLARDESVVLSGVDTVFILSSAEGIENPPAAVRTAARQKTQVFNQAWITVFPESAPLSILINGLWRASSATKTELPQDYDHICAYLGKEGRKGDSSPGWSSSNPAVTFAPA
jgi:hypothetical protein